MTNPALAPFYCITGDELLLRTEEQDRLRAVAREAGFTERTTLSFDARSSKDDWAQVWEVTQSLSLFADKHFVEITVASGKPGKTGGTQLQELVQAVKTQRTADSVIVLILPKLDKTTANTAWAKAVFSTAQVIQLPVITRQQLPNWIKQRFKQQNQTVDEATLQWLVDTVEGNLFAAHQEILKLGLLFPAGHISFEDIQQSVQNVARYDVFSLNNAMLMGDASRCLHILSGLQAEGNELPMVLGAVLMELRDLAFLAQARQEGRSLDRSLFTQLRIFSQRETALRTALNRLSLAQTFGLIQQAHDIDSLFKGIPVAGRSNNAWYELERLVLRVAQFKAVLN